MFHFISLFICVFCLFFHTPARGQDRPVQQEMEEILIYVQDSNPTLKAAQAELQATMELYPQARSGWLPSLSGEASLYATNIDASNFNNGDGATTKDMTLRLDQPIWHGGRTFAEAGRAKDLIRAGHATLRQHKQNLLFDVVTAYMDVLRDRQLFVLYQRNEGILAQEVQSAQERFDIGELTETDVQQAKARQAKAQSLRLLAARDLHVSNAKYEEFVGMKVPANMLFPLGYKHLPNDLQQMLTQAQEINPDLQIATYKHQASEHEADAVFRELLPQISAFASVNKQYDPQPGIIADSQVETIGLRASIDLFRGGKTHSRVRQARAEAKRKGYNIEEVKRRIEQDITSNWRAYRAAVLQAQTIQNEIDAAKLALEGVREEASLGQRTIMDILDADEDVIEAQVLHARAKRDEVVAQYALARSIGLPLAARPE